MDAIREQVARARRRLVWEQFLSRLAWCQLAGLIAAAVAIAVPRLFVIETLPSGWDLGWIVVGAGLGLLVDLQRLSFGQPAGAAQRWCAVASIWHTRSAVKGAGRKSRSGWVRSQRRCIS